MKIVDTKAEPPFRVRVNRTGRRTYSREYKLEIVEQCSAPGASVAAIALSHRINANIVRKWLVLHRAGKLCGARRAESPALLPVTVSPRRALTPSSSAEAALPHAKHSSVGVIEIELESARVCVRGAVDHAVLRTVLGALR